MGVFDYVNIPCPKCGELVQSQNKSTWEQYLHTYHWDEIQRWPDAVVEQGWRSPYHCKKCDTHFKIAVSVKPEFVILTPEEANELEQR